jgi:hypothetical protein
MSELDRFIATTLEKPANIAVPMGLFFLLTPGNFVRIPGATQLIEFPRLGPNRQVVLTHMAALGLTLAFLRFQFPQFY